MKIRYVSSFAVGTLHAVINRALLGMLCDIYPGKVDCHASQSTVDELTDGLGIDKKDIHTVFVPSGSSRRNTLLRYIFSAFTNLRILLKSRPEDIVFFNYNNVFCLKAIDRLSRRLKRRVVVCCHGEMEYLSNSSLHRRAYKKLMSRLTCSYFNKDNTSPAPGLRFIVFGDVILKNIRPYVSPELYERFSSLDHPVGTCLTPRAEAPGDGCIHVGTVGIMNDYKGAGQLLDIARELNGSKQVKLHIVGHIQDDATRFKKVGIEIPADPDRPLTEEEFEKGVAGLDYILLLYPADTYRLIASGAVLDCIRFRKPVLALATEYFRYLFDKFGRFGYLADSVDELTELLRHPERLPRSDYDFDAIAEALRAETLTPQLKEIMNRHEKGADA